MRIAAIFIVLSLAALPLLSAAQSSAGLDPSVLLKPLSDAWPTYSGDYTGRRFSSLTQVNRNTVKNLTLSWVARLNGTASGADQTIVGGVGAGEYTNVNVKGSIVYFDDTIYVTSADHVWAMDGRDGRLLWRYFWRTRGGTHTGNRGVGIWHNYLFFETPDDYLVSLDAKTGKERWHIEIADFEQQYFSTMAPIVVGDHLLVGTGNDLDAPGFLQSYDPETGKLQWKLYTVPMNPGDAGLETWPNLDAARHGGGQVWIPGAYDPETKLYIFGTGNPTPAYTGVGRRGDNLFTCSLIAVNVDAGKMAWYFQTSVHDTHDWDSTETPVLIDGVINGRQRKLVSTAQRNGYFYTLDRVTGESIVTAKYGLATNWARSTRPNGVVDPDPVKEATIAGSLVSPVESGVTNWPPAAYSPETELFYVPEHNGFNLLYLTDPDLRGSMGLGGKSVSVVGSAGDFLTAIDYKTGRVAWRKPIAGGGVGAGLLATAGGLLFAGDGSGNFMALDSRDGKPLWHTRIGNASNAPETYLVDGRQHLLIAVGDTLYAFTLY
jgi:alcohol dehydrogenase (cytochrome c)